MTRGDPDFGNWIRLRIVGAFLVLGTVALVGALRVGDGWLSMGLAAAGSPLLGMGLYLSYLYYQFADWGGGLQRALWSQTLAALAWDGAGRALDVGTGNGALAILLAQRHPCAHVSGVDPWGASWEYSQGRCRENAEASGVRSRTTFLQGSAVALPFESDLFDAVVSHFVFHEVPVSDKLDVVCEALRVLRPGGAFAFQDMFFDPRFYGEAESLKERLRSLDLAEVELVDTPARMPLPPLMKSRRVLGSCGILRGRK